MSNSDWLILPALVCLFHHPPASPHPLLLSLTCIQALATLLSFISSIWSEFHSGLVQPGGLILHLSDPLWPGKAHLGLTAAAIHRRLLPRHIYLRALFHRRHCLCQVLHPSALLSSLQYQQSKVWYIRTVGRGHSMGYCRGKLSSN